MNLAIIGCGLMGQQRARSVSLMSRQAKVVVVYDPDPAKAQPLAEKLGCHSADSLAELLEWPGYDVAIIAVPHWIAKDTTIAALRAGKHVLCEKPMGLNAEQAREVIRTAEMYKRRLTPGFNYRFYPGFQAAARALEEHRIGRLTHIRAQFGHGARPGYEKEWKTSKALCGGGALIDPGVHFIDLIRFFAGEIRGGSAQLVRSFWEIDVEDNAFVHFQTEQGVNAQLHISITEWRSRSAVDLFGEDGCIQIRGRSGFYGAQVLRLKRRWDWLEPVTPEFVQEFPKEDTSFAAEMSAFADLLDGGVAPDLATPRDGIRALEVVENLYRAYPINAVMDDWGAVASRL